MFDITAQREFLGQLTVYKEEWDAIPIEATGDPDQFYILNNWFGPVDAELLYAMVRHLQPSRMIEIGSGMSTLCTSLALSRNETACRLTAIDPDPKHDLEGLGIKVRKQPLQEVGLRTFKLLGSNDILFIDSSHIWEPGNDVDLEYHSILPTLPSGVVVHCHDIFLPEDYPWWWGHRGYSEQEHLRPLLESGEWEILWTSYFMHRSDPETLRYWFKSYGPRDYPASFWMRKK